MKSGEVDASHVAQQLQGGADVFAETARGIRNVRFFPIIVYLRGIGSIEYKAIGVLSVRFRGRKYSVIPAKSGASLDETIRSVS